MSFAGAFAWNVLVSAAFAFTVALVFVAAARRRAFANRRPRIAAAFLALPFAKAVVELARGVPSSAFFWSKLHGAVQDKGSFQVGLGVDRWGPTVRIALGAVRGDTVVPQSAADILATGLDRRIGHGASSMLGIGLASVGLVLLVLDLAGLVRARRALGRHVAQGTVVATRKLTGRTVRIVVSSTWRGVPFAGGLVAPFVCIGAATWDAASEDERDAIVLHELAHLRWLDAPVLVAARLVARVLWFVPWSGRVVRALAAQCEVAADADAVARGAKPEALASALVTVAAAARGDAMPLLAFGKSSTLARRVECLLEEPAPQRSLRAHAPMLALLVIATWTILRMTACGNSP